MNKSNLKQVILAINEASLICDTKRKLFREIKDRTGLSDTKIYKVIDLLEKHRGLEWLNEEIDLFPCAVIYARSKTNSLIENLSFWEMFKDDEELLEEIGFEVKDHHMLEYMERIRKEDPDKIVSDTLSILYTNSIVQRTKNMPHKNENRSIVPLPNRDFLYQIMPKRGIPTNRDVSKDLQIYFKDTLMHEFNRTCPVCGIHLPHMLIASHIKPFRDCAHIFEAADHNNGLLLCRNHDYLFDQGYITYTDEGKLVVSRQLKHPEHYQLHDLNKKIMTENRKLYMDYHRKHIFLGKI